MIEEYKNLLSMLEPICLESRRTKRKLEREVVRLGEKQKALREIVDDSDKILGKKYNEEKEQIKLECKELLRPAQELEEKKKTLVEGKETLIAQVDLEPFMARMSSYISLKNRTDKTVAYINESMGDLGPPDTLDLNSHLGELVEVTREVTSEGISRKIRDLVRINKKRIVDNSQVSKKIQDSVHHVLSAPLRIGKSNMTKIALGLGLLAVIGLAFVHLSFLLLGALGYAGYAIYSSVKSKKQAEKDLYTLKRLRDEYLSLTKFIEQKKEEYTKECMILNEQKINQEIQALSDSIERIENEYNRTLNERIASINLDDLKKELAEQQELLKMSLEGDVTRQEEVVANLRSELDRLEEAYNRQMEEVLAKKEQLVNTYFNLTKVGSEKLFNNTYLLGFRDLEPVTIDNGNKSLFIVYNGRDSKDNEQLIHMLIIQIFGTMQPNLLNFYIQDTKNLCSSYAMYKSQSDIASGVNNMMTFVSLEDGIKPTIDFFTDETQQRQSMMASLADNILEFNQARMDKGSVPADYYVYIIQDLDDRTSKNSNFMSILRTGPQWGIYPIIFISKQMYSDLKAETAKNAADRDKVKVELYEEICKNKYNLDHKTQDLER